MQKCQEKKKKKKMPWWHLRYLMNMMLYFRTNYANRTKKDQILKYPYVDVLERFIVKLIFTEYWINAVPKSEKLITYIRNQIYVT